MHLTFRIASQLNITMFIDIGANEGKVSESLIKAGYTGKVVCIEPLSFLNKKLSRKFANSTLVKVMEPFALDRENAAKTFQQSENLVSSSLKTPNSAYIYAAPGSKIERKELVRTRRLDSVLFELSEEKFKAKKERMMLKIDVQGSEDDVLEGLGDYWDEVHCVIVETSLVPLYQNQMLFSECIELMRGRGFEIWRIFPGHSDGISGRMLQCDILFVKVKQNN